ncbi:hypothetical protein CcI6DRAFT_03651 [Frankia sp. CcI6]|nr:hypothetical protein CcI6DRAFT_03651 [Frankia sp. CcI6]OAA28866.1 hypothetical protein AAY23_101830 [Frankia casuarinae]
MCGSGPDAGCRRVGWWVFGGVVPAQAERAVHQGRVAGDRGGGADLDVGPAEFVCDLFVVLFDPAVRPVQAVDLAVGGGWERRCRRGGQVGVGQGGGQIPGTGRWQGRRVGGGHDQPRWSAGSGCARPVDAPHWCQLARTGGPVPDPSRAARRQNNAPSRPVTPGSGRGGVGGVGRDQTRAVTAIATNSRVRYVIDMWNRRIGLGSSPCRARRATRCDSTRNQAPTATAATR